MGYDIPPPPPIDSPAGSNLVSLVDGEASLCEQLHRGEGSASTLKDLAEREDEKRARAAVVQTVGEIQAYADFLSNQPLDPQILARFQAFEVAFASRVESILSNCCLAATPAVRVETAKKVAQAAGVLGERWMPYIDALARGDVATLQFPSSPQRLNWGTRRADEPWREYGIKLVALKRALQSATNDPVAVCFCQADNQPGLHAGGSVAFTVYVDGAPVNRGIVWEGTRLLGSVQEKLSGVVFGHHEYLVRLEGFQDATVRIDIASTNTVPAPVELHPIPPITLVRIVPPDSTLRIRTSESAQATEYHTDEHGWLTLRLPEGEYILEMFKPDYLAQELRYVVHRGQDSTIAAALSQQPGRLLVNATASDGTALAAAIHSRGQVLGITGETVDPMPAGTNIVQVVLAEYITKTITVVIPPNQNVVTNISLVPLSGPDPLRELVKDLHGCRKWGIDIRDYEKCRSDIEGIRECVAASIRNAHNPDLAIRPEVLGAQEEIWEGVVGRAVEAFLEPPPKDRDWRFLALARGALTACLRTGAATNATQVLSGWTERNPEVGENIPWPRGVGAPIPAMASTELFLTGLPPDVRARSIALSVLPSAMAVQILSKSDVDSRSNTTRFLLVPDGLSPAESGLRVEQPFYMMETEVTAELMRRCREGVSQLLTQDPNLHEYLVPLTNLPPSAASTMPYATAQVDQAITFCNWLSYRANLPVAYRRKTDIGGWLFDRSRPGFRLPTEEEWEYAARTGFDWLAAPGGLSWAQMERVLDGILLDGAQRNRDDLLVYFGNKVAPRDTAQVVTNRYPLGFRDLCGNVAEICMSVTGGEGDRRDVEFFARGGSFKSRSTESILPTTRPSKAIPQLSDRLDLGFRVVLPMPIEVPRTNPIGGPT